ncbi:pyranose dehydrogenase [Mycena leptocephala]|nr:pyranose dehydrogenase [Mycena leptocephala]
MLARALVTLAYLVPCFCKIYDDVAHLPGLSYDFVIWEARKFLLFVVPAGITCPRWNRRNVVANRLTENPAWSVLVLEAGVSNEGVIDSIVPALLGNLVSEPNIYEWRNPRDGMAYTRGSEDDYNRFAAVTGDPGWSWDSLLPYFFKNEKWTPPVENHDTRGQFDPSVHSTTGINSVSLAGFPWPIFSQHVLEATKELQGEWAFNLDMNSGKPLGLSWSQSTIGGGERSSSATSYFGPQFIHRQNLHAQVSKLVDPGRVGGKLTFGGVQFAQAKAAKEIILSAGSVGTPNILLHSGIGDQATFTDLSIPTLLDLPSVGRNASDQPLFGAGWFVNSNQTRDSIIHNATRFNEAFAQWNRSHTGPLSALGTTHIGWLRLSPETLALQLFAVQQARQRKKPTAPVVPQRAVNNFADPSAGPDSPHIEVAWASDSAIVPANNYSMGAAMVVLNPNDVDIFTARQAVQKVLQLSRLPHGATISPHNRGPGNMSQDALDEYIRNTAQSASHLVGTAAMSAKNARYGVVDPDLRVKGALDYALSTPRSSWSNIYAQPFVPSAHTQAATYVIAERGADLVKAAWK